MENILITIGTFILGYFTGVYLPKKFRKKDNKPKISIGPFQERYNYFDVTNHGGDILNLAIEIFWLQNGIKLSKKIERFGTSNSAPLRENPHNCNSLKKSETKKAYECPVYSDDGKVEVIINGEDIGGQKYKEIFILQNKIKK